MLKNRTHVGSRASVGVQLLSGRRGCLAVMVVWNECRRELCADLLLFYVCSNCHFELELRQRKVLIKMVAKALLAVGAKLVDLGFLSCYILLPF
jgi:hypothetical protein